jgi:hypothetical protein
MRRPRRARTAIAAIAADCGPPERARRGELVPRGTGVPGQSGRRVRHECRLDWYQDKGSLDDRRHEAGLRFRRDWLLAAASPKVVGTYGLRLAGRQDFTTLQLAARRRVARALAVLDQSAGAVVIDVCGFDAWASGRLPELRDALTLLADHYGIARHGA